jgi:hypothetical protein
MRCSGPARGALMVKPVLRVLRVLQALMALRVQLKCRCEVLSPVRRRARWTRPQPAQWSTPRALHLIRIMLRRHGRRMTRRDPPIAASRWSACRAPLLLLTVARRLRRSSGPLEPLLLPEPLTTTACPASLQPLPMGSAWPRYARDSRTSTAGSFLPSRNSRKAPPPVEM